MNAKSQRVSLTSYVAPADSSVRYDHVRYNITTMENPFVGAGPEVDKAWREISYDSECTISLECARFNKLESGRPVDFEVRSLEARYARDFS